MRMSYMQGVLPVIPMPRVPEGTATAMAPLASPIIFNRGGLALMGFI